MSALTLLLVVAGCAPKPVPVGEVTATIGAEGGTLEGLDGVSVTIPPGALASTQTFRLARDGTGAPALPAWATALSQISSITPHVDWLAQPAQVSIPVDLSGVDLTRGRPVLLIAEPGGEWEQLPASQLKDGALIGLSTHFSYVVAGLVLGSFLTDLTLDFSDGVTPPRVWLSDRGFRVSKPTGVRVSMGMSPATFDPSSPDSPTYCSTPMTVVLTVHTTTSHGTQSVQLTSGPFSSPASTSFDMTLDASNNGYVDVVVRDECTRVCKPGFTCPTLEPVYDEFAFFFVSVLPPPEPPVITLQPQPQTVTAGQTGTFSVDAMSASDSLTIAWQRSNDAGASWADAGGTLASYSQTFQLVDDGALFRAHLCTVRASDGQQACLDSASAALTVQPAPTLPVVTISPTSLLYLDGETVSITATATGRPAPEIHISQGALPGGRQVLFCPPGSGGSTTCTYMAALTWLDSGAQFFAFAFNAAGGATSDPPTTVTVTAAHLPPSVTGQPSPAATTIGGSAAFTVTATGEAPLAYRWQFNGVDLADRTSGAGTSGVSGSGSATLSLSNVQPADVGNYRVVLSNAGGTVTSAEAALTLVSSPVLSLLAGSLGGHGNFDGLGSAARFMAAFDVAVDASGNAYVVDATDCTIRKVTPAGLVTTFAGSPGLPGSTDGTGAAARFRNPNGITIDAAGTLYVADTENFLIRTVSPAGEVHTLAGQAGYNLGNDGTGAGASFLRPYRIAIDSTNTLYVADLAMVRKITAGAVVTTLAGSSLVGGWADGPGVDARFDGAMGIAVDGSGQVYVADSNNRVIRSITPGGDVTTLAGTHGGMGLDDATGPAATFSSPRGLVYDGAGRLLVTDDATVRAITLPGAVVSTWLGAGYQHDSTDGTGIAARFTTPNGLAFNAGGTLYVADDTALRTVTKAAKVSTLAGLESPEGNVDGTGSAARFAQPQGVAVGPGGVLVVADTYDETLRQITPAGVVTTFVGSGLTGGANGHGLAAQLSHPWGLALDSSGTISHADSMGSVLRTTSWGGDVSTLAGLYDNPGHDDAQGAAASFNSPRGVALDAAGNLYVADFGNQLIRKVTPPDTVSTLAGTFGAVGGADGVGSAARFYYPSALTVDAAGNLYVADSGAGTIRKVTPAGAVSTLAGTFNTAGFVDGTGPAARFITPVGIAVDATGTLYVADSGNNAIRKISPEGVVTTILGKPHEVGLRLGADGRLSSPKAVALVGPRQLAILSGNAVLLLSLP